MPRTSSLLAFTLSLTLVGCAAVQAPAPAPSPEVGAVEGDSGPGVSLEAARGWEEGGVSDMVTPVRLALQNRGSAPVRIDYPSFALVDSAGRYFAALPLYRLSGSMENPAIEPPAQLPGAAFRATGFWVAPAYAGLYPELPGFSGPFFHEPQYHSHYLDHWSTIPLPTPRMLQVGLPEGVLDPGGELGGYLFFEPVPDGAEGLRLRFDLTNPFTGERFGSLAVPIE